MLFGGPFTGAAMNPSRAFGPQLVGDHWANGWVWYVGPVLGASVAALVYEFLYLRKTPSPSARSAGEAEPEARHERLRGERALVVPSEDASVRGVLRTQRPRTR